MNLHPPRIAFILKGFLFLFLLCSAKTGSAQPLTGIDKPYSGLYTTDVPITIGLFDDGYYAVLGTGVATDNPPDFGTYTIVGNTLSMKSVVPAEEMEVFSRYNPNVTSGIQLLVSGDFAKTTCYLQLDKGLFTQFFDEAVYSMYKFAKDFYKVALAQKPHTLTVAHINYASSRQFNTLVFKLNPAHNEFMITYQDIFRDTATTEGLLRKRGDETLIYTAEVTFVRDNENTKTIRHMQELLTDWNNHRNDIFVYYNQQLQQFKNEVLLPAANVESLISRDYVLDEDANLFVLKKFYKAGAGYRRLPVLETTGNNYLSRYHKAPVQTRKYIDISDYSVADKPLLKVEITH